jgi:DNA polymerase (family 10)
MPKPTTSTHRALTNHDVARRLLAVAQQLQVKGENPYKVRAYRRAAETISALPVSIEREVRAGKDLTRYPGIGKSIAGALHDIVTHGGPGQLELLLASTAPEIAALHEYPRLDPKQVSRAYRILQISSVADLKDKLKSGDVKRHLGLKSEYHFQQALTEVRHILLEDTDPLARKLRSYLLKTGGASQAEAVGAYRRRVEVIEELAFLVATDDFPRLVSAVEQYGGHVELISSTSGRATFRLPIGILLHLQLATLERWGLAEIEGTGSNAHIRKLKAASPIYAQLQRKPQQGSDETSVYRAIGMPWIPPELREGHDEVERALKGRLPSLIEAKDIEGELHAHTTSSDGSHTIEEMASAARDRGYSYLGITDHSQSLKIARGVSEEALWQQIRTIDRLNEKQIGIRLLKSAEVDILADGSLDYSDALLAALDYTVCSIHSKFRLGKVEQTERIMRAMDHPRFTFLGHATGRLLLRRPGYEIDLPRLVDHARSVKVYFEINASPDRLDLSADNARAVKSAGIKIAICTDAHHVRELDYMRCGIDVARRAGLEKEDVLNCLSCQGFLRSIKR